jgi:tetratricopeptide (TPR) repeat protein
MLAMVRGYAQERLLVRGEFGMLHDRLLAACIDLAERSEDHLRFSGEQALWMARMEAEGDTLRAALEWAATTNGAQGLRLVGALWRFWYMRGMLREGRRWLETFLALPLEDDAIARAHALDGAGILAWRQGAYGQADTWLNAALGIYQGVQHRHGTARVLSHIGMVTADRGAFDQALGWYEASLPLYRELGDSTGAASVLHNLGNLHCHQNNHERALELYTECLTIYEQQGNWADIALISLGIGAVARDQGAGEAANAAFARSLALAQSLGDEWTAGTALLNLGDSACDCGDIPEGQRRYSEALAIFERLGDQQQVLVVQARLAMAAFLAGERATAVDLFRQSLLLANALGFQPGLSDGLEGLAICAAQQDPLLAAKLFAAATGCRAALGLPIPLADQARHDQAVRMAQHGADPVTWTRAWAEGQRLATSQAVTLALTHVHSR